MKKKISAFYHNPYENSVVKIILLILCLYIVITVWKWKMLPAELPLFYSLPRGPEQLGSPILFLLLPGLSLVLFLLDFLFAVSVYHKDKVLAHALVTIGLFTAVLLFISFVKIIFLIT
ncbi:hypothetical protein A2Y99_00600 [Candidatus Gottesmanbacteria bacterium RBG_13_37_7]|uniref:DUF1648 domain-containing protein n=1 Tax=Candidatus Gottesmanbacteria bacterium RBG_13_37_7 TaxID=1798369 RepID=A0A1F5YGZ8_9BACT|nr:MAG: hypothetical protein A2Y99_00600 [Candidatus Gottesmanbacteria bacterium RBG_13_37_7]